MLIRRSVFAIIIGSAVLLSLSLVLWNWSNITTLSPWHLRWSAHQHNGDYSWPDPEPGVDEMRKNPTPMLQDNDDDAFPHHRPMHSIEDIGVSSPLLRSRLQALLNAPVKSHAVAAEQNEVVCPRKYADGQVNQDQFRDNHERWISVSESEIHSRRAAIVRYLEALDKRGILIMGGDGKWIDEGKGIVMTAGNMDTAHTALVTLRILREEYKSQLPVQIFSFPKELTDQSVINEMLELNATLHEIEGLQKIPGAWKNFQLKAMSIVGSSFAEVLYLDSDNIPLRDPAYLFDSEFYKRSGGAVFWPDFNKDHPDNAVWRVLGKTCNYSEWEVESGQMLIDKRGNEGLNLAALHIAAHMQADNDFWFSLSGGDKDTFRYAFWALGAHYLAAPRWLSALGTSYPVWDRGRFCGFVMLQHDIVRNEEGQYLPLFVHANLLKHRFGGAATNKQYFQTIKRASHDDAGDRRLDRVRMWVYQEGGMCVDLELLSDSGAEGDGRGQQIIVEQFTEVYGQIFKNFEDRFFRHKGKVGGW